MTTEMKITRDWLDGKPPNVRTEILETGEFTLSPCGTSMAAVHSEEGKTLVSVIVAPSISVRRRDKTKLINRIDVTLRKGDQATVYESHRDADGGDTLTIEQVD